MAASDVDACPATGAMISVQVVSQTSLSLSETMARLVEILASGKVDIGDEPSQVFVDFRSAKHVGESTCLRGLAIRCQHEVMILHSSQLAPWPNG